MVVTLGQQHNIGEKPPLYYTLTLIAIQGHQKDSEKQRKNKQKQKHIKHVSNNILLHRL